MIFNKDRTLTYWDTEQKLEDVHFDKDLSGQVHVDADFFESLMENIGFRKRP